MSMSATPPTSAASTSALSCAEAVEARGYRVVEDPTTARFVLQANVLQAGRSSHKAAEAASGDGFGDVLGGAAGGAAGYGPGAAGVSINNTEGTIVGALAGAAIAGLANAYVQDTTYTIVTSIQVSERAPLGVGVGQSEQASLSQGTSGTISQSSAVTTDAKRYRTRVVSTANQVNLAWEDAQPELVAGMSRSIGGISARAGPPLAQRGAVPSPPSGRERGYQGWRRPGTGPRAIPDERCSRPRPR